MELINQTNLEFIDISSEEWRRYVYPAKIGHVNVIEIDRPLYLAITENGHRILDYVGQSHYIPAGWIQLTWQAAEGQPHFVR